MNHLLRSLAPITDPGWELLDREAKQRLAAALAARKLVDFAGPRGWEHSATNLGRATAVAKVPGEGVTALQRRVLPLVELRAAFTVPLAELRDHARIDAHRPAEVGPAVHHPMSDPDQPVPGKLGPEEREQVIEGPIVAEIFEGKHFGAIFSLLMASLIAGGAVGPFVTGLLHDWTGNYDIAFAIGVVLSVACAVAVWLAAPRKVRLVAGSLR